MLLSNPFDTDPRVYNIARALLKEYKVTVFAWDRKGGYPSIETIDGIQVIRTSLKSTYGKGIKQLLAFMLFQIKALVFLLKNNFDIAHPNDFDTLIPAFVAAKIKRKKIVYDCHEDYPAMMKDRNLNFIAFVIDKIQSFIIKRLDLILVVSPLFEKAFEEKGAKNIKRIFNCKNIDDYFVGEEEIKQLRGDLGIENKFVFLYIGALTVNRNLKELLDIFERISDPNAVLVMGGLGVLKEEVENKAASSKNIKFIGKISPDKIPLYSKAADVIVAVYSKKSLNNVRSIPNKIFEAIAAGKPIIGSNAGPLGHIIEETGCGLAINADDVEELKNAILRLISDKKFYDKLSSNAIEAQKIYNWERTSKILIESYEKL